MATGKSAGESTADAVAGRAHSLLAPSFLGLLATQFLGAANDNVLRWLVIGLGKTVVEESHESFILGVGTFSFVLPYMLLAAPAGYLADRFSKRTVIVVCKAAEVAIMGLAIGSIYLGNVWLMLTVLALIGSQAALFGPAKLGSIPEMLHESRISAANGIIGLATVVATTVGCGVGMWLADQTKGHVDEHIWLEERIWLSALALIGLAVAGLGASLLIAPLPTANPQRKFPWDAAPQTWRDLTTLRQNPALWRVALGIAFFWSLAALTQLNIDQFAFEGDASEQSHVTPLLVALVAGVGAGSVLAGAWSAGRVELGILPLGAGGLVLVSLTLFTVEGSLFEPSGEWTLSYLGAALLLFLLGCSAGLFDLPLAAYMQHYSPPERRGSILAASNFLTFGGMLAVSLLFILIRWPVFSGSLAGAVTAAGDDPARQALVQSLWDSMRSDQGAPAGSGEEGVSLHLGPYLESHPGHKPLVRHVYQEVIGYPLLSARQIFLLCGMLTLPVLIYIVVLIPQATLRFLAWLTTHTAYKIRVMQADNLPSDGGVLLVANHVSWLDGLLMVAVCPRPVRMMITGDLVTTRLARGLARIMGAIPISRSPKAAQSALVTARQALNNGEVVCLFPEGRITRSGQLQPFRPSVLKVLKGTSAPVAPVYLDELWGSIFSYWKGRFFWRRPRLSPRRLSVWFGKPLERPANAFEIRQAVQSLGADAVTGRGHVAMVLPRLMIRTCRRALFRWKIADSTGQSLTGGQLLMRSLILRRLLMREVFGADEKYVGLLLPPSNGAVIVNSAVTLSGRVACNLNYTLASDVMNKCIKKAGIRHVLTSAKVVEKLDLRLDAQLVLLEDLKDKVTLADKALGAALAYAAPAAAVDRALGLHRIQGDDELTVIFTSGSTGDPKGVVLTHYNVASNVEAIDHVIRLQTDDTILGIVPFFHSLGYTVTLWTVLGLDVHSVYHFSPLDAKQIGKLARTHKATVLLATPTFLRNYLRRCEADDFKSLDIAVAGAEKLPIPLCDAFEKKFGVRPVEGYGATETSPLVSVNVPPSRSQSKELDAREGTVGRPVPGVAVKVVDPDSLADLGVDKQGMLLVKGPNVMKGYLYEPDKTAAVVRDGWYVTGDIARIDEQGFIEITGRLSRFSKIGGEMVPHLNIEEAIAHFVQGEDQDEVCVVVTGVPDEKKGERLVVVHKKMKFAPAEVCDHLKQIGFPNLFIPGADSFMEVDEIPLLGTGKLDLKGVSQLARQRFGDGS